MSTESETRDALQTLFLETGQVFARHYLGFVRQHRYDFGALRTEWDNILQAVNLSLKHAESHLLSEGLEVLGQLAMVAEAQGYYDQARDLRQMQIQGCDQVGHETPEVYVAALSQLVRLARRQEDYAEAQVFLQRWLKIAQEQENVREQVDIMMELAEVHERRNELELAELRYQHGLETARDIGYRVGVMRILAKQASIRRAQRRYQDAQKLYRAALDVALEIGDQIGAGEIREHLVTLDTAMGRNIFISYNRNDLGFVERFTQDLKAAGFAVWWDKWEIKVGDSIIQKVSEGINQSAYLIIVLSPNSVQSPWVQRELGSALMRQLSTERRITILPLKIAECEVPPLISEIMWADFTQDYQVGLRELLGALVKTDDD